MHACMDQHICTCIYDHQSNQHSRTFPIQPSTHGAHQMERHSVCSSVSVSGYPSCILVGSQLKSGPPATTLTRCSYAGRFRCVRPSASCWQTLQWRPRPQAEGVWGHAERNHAGSIRRIYRAQARSTTNLWADPADLRVNVWS